MPLFTMFYRCHPHKRFRPLYVAGLGMPKGLFVRPPSGAPRRHPPADIPRPGCARGVRTRPGPILHGLHKALQHVVHRGRFQVKRDGRIEDAGRLDRLYVLGVVCCCESEARCYKNVSPVRAASVSQALTKKMSTPHSTRVPAMSQNTSGQGLPGICSNTPKTTACSPA